MVDNTNGKKIGIISLLKDFKKLCSKRLEKNIVCVIKINKSAKRADRV